MGRIVRVIERNKKAATATIQLNPTFSNHNGVKCWLLHCSQVKHKLSSVVSGFIDVHYSTKLRDPFVAIVFRQNSSLFCARFESVENRLRFFLFFWIYCRWFLLIQFTSFIFLTRRCGMLCTNFTQFWLKWSRYK